MTQGEYRPNAIAYGATNMCIG